MSEINVLYAFDSRFWKLAAVSMHSLLANKKPDTDITIYCMVAPHTNGKRQIQKMISGFPRAGLVWRVIKKSENPFQSYEYSRWSPVIFYRLIACSIFPNIDKLLYLDSDTLVCGDLSELFNTNISNYALGAVRDMAPTEDADNPNGKYVREFAENHLQNAAYFNSGILLMNLKNMAKNQQLLLDVKVPLKYPDQDILNVGLHKQNYYQYVPHDMYTMFYKHCTALNFYPDEFIADEQKHFRKRKQSTRTNIPFLRIQNNTIRLFGIKIISF